MAVTQKQAQPPVWPVVVRLVRMAGRGQSWLYGAIVLDVAQAAMLVFQADFIRRIFDSVGPKDMDTFWRYTIIAIVLTFVSVPLSYLKTLGIGRFSEGALAKIRGAVAEKGRALPVPYMEQRHSGDMLSVLNADLGKLKALLQNNLLDTVANIVRGVAALGYMLYINWVLTLVATVATPLIFIVIQALTAPVSKRSEEVQEEIGAVNSVAKDGLSGAMVIKAFNLTGILENQFHDANMKALKKGLSIARLRALIDSLGMGLSITPFIIAMGLGGYLIFQGQMTFGGMFAFINLLNYVVNPMGFLPQVFASIAEAAGAGRRVLELVDQAPERSDGLDLSPNGGKYAIRFDGVTFAYTAGGAPVLKDVSLDVLKGQTVAVVGPSGGGKSTLVKLILGYYPLDDGRVELFGRDLNDWMLPAARRQMAFVAQDTYLFPVSIGENIRLGKPAASQEDIEHAARMANIHDFIVSLPKGYDTPAGEWGSRLSGGQKQRISLARAILKDAPILLLDEPTSALDAESESLVQQSLERFTRGDQQRTTVVIAHRLSTIKNADRVVVIHDGQVVEEGTHDELMARGGVYLDLYQRQFANGDSLAQPALAPEEK